MKKTGQKDSTPASRKEARQEGPLEKNGSPRGAGKGDGLDALSRRNQKQKKKKSLLTVQAPRSCRTKTPAGKKLQRAEEAARRTRQEMTVTTMANSQALIGRVEEKVLGKKGGGRRRRFTWLTRELKSKQSKVLERAGGGTRICNLGCAAEGGKGENRKQSVP